MTDRRNLPPPEKHKLEDPNNSKQRLKLQKFTSTTGLGGRTADNTLAGQINRPEFQRKIFPLHDGLSTQLPEISSTSIRSTYWSDNNLEKLADKYIQLHIDDQHKDSKELNNVRKKIFQQEMTTSDINVFKKVVGQRCSEIPSEKMNQILIDAPAFIENCKIIDIEQFSINEDGMKIISEFYASDTSDTDTFNNEEIKKGSELVKEREMSQKEIANAIKNLPEPAIGELVKIRKNAASTLSDAASKVHHKQWKIVKHTCSDMLIYCDNYPINKKERLINKMRKDLNLGSYKVKEENAAKAYKDFEALVESKIISSGRLKEVLATLKRFFQNFQNAQSQT